MHIATSFLYFIIAGLCEIGGGGRTFDPVYVPGGVHGDEGKGISAEPGFVDHFGWQ